MQQKQTELAAQFPYPSDCFEGATRTNGIRRDCFLTLPIAWRVQQEQTEFAVTVFLPFRLLGECNKSRQNSP